MTDEHKLDTGIDTEKQRLADAIGGSTEETEILGYGVMYTVGADWNCLVPREWLIERMDDLGLPQWLAPSETRPHDAYRRAMKRMREDWLDREWTVHVERPDTGQVEPHTVTVDLKQGDSTYLWHVRAEVFFDENEVHEEGGKWIQHDLGYITYDTEGKYVQARKDDSLASDALGDVWDSVAAKATQFYGEMQELHIAHDIRMLMYHATREHTNTVIKLRRSVYLFPAGMESFVEKMGRLYDDINEKFKEGGEPVAVRTVEILDTDDKREWIQHRVEQTLSENIDSLLEEAFESFDEGETADSVVRMVKQELGSDEETAEMYNALLETQLRVEEVLREKKKEVVDSEHEDIVERVLSQADIGDF